MKVDDNPFPGDQNMVDARLLKGKTKVLTSTRSRETRTIDPEMQISLMNIEKLEDVAISKRADMSREKHQKMGRQSRGLHLEFY